MDQRGWGLWAVDVEGVFTGFTGLNMPTFKAPFTPCTEIGWRFAREYWGRGLATRAVLEALRFGYLELRLSGIVSFTTASNTRSRRLSDEDRRRLAPRAGTRPGKCRNLRVSGHFASWLALSSLHRCDHTHPRRALRSKWKTVVAPPGAPLRRSCPPGFFSFDGRPPSTGRIASHVVVVGPRTALLVLLFGSVSPGGRSGMAVGSWASWDRSPVMLPCSPAPLGVFVPRPCRGDRVGSLTWKLTWSAGNEECTMGQAFEWIVKGETRFRYFRHFGNRTRTEVGSLSGGV